MSGVSAGGWSGRILGAGWTAAGTLLAPGLRYHLRRRAGQGREIAARLAEREGIDRTPRPAGRLLWLHAASVGETMSILPVLSALAGQVTVLLTTGTVTAQALLDQRLGAMGLSGHVLHRFAPLDVPAWIDRFLSHWEPDAACFVESELWPNQIAACRVRGIKLMLMNARMSDRSFARWRRIPGLARRLLGSFTLIQARSEADADRLRHLGAEHVECLGDLKFAALPLPVDTMALARLTASLAGRPAWLAASTHPGEEAILAGVHRRLSETHPDLITIIAPRHPERGPALAAELGAPRRAAGQDLPSNGIWIADTLGELGLWYRLAPISFVGRSLLPPGGGQNPLEPARLGCAVAVGPFCANFADHVALLREAGALAQVPDAASLAGFVAQMLAAPQDRQRMGARAAELVRRHEDLPLRTAGALLSLLPTG